MPIPFLLYEFKLLDPIIESLVAKIFQKIIKNFFPPSNHPISKYTNITLVTDYHSPKGNNLLHTHGVKQGTPIQGRQKAPSKREVLVERKPQHPLLFAAAAAAPKDSKCFQDRPRSFLSRWFCHFAARKERALTRADHKTRRNRAISRDPADKPAFAAPPRGVSFLPRMQNCLLFFRAMPPPCPD